ncbi:MAG: tetratricopeptide repeat protein [Pseudomonadales bacterium]
MSYRLPLLTALLLALLLASVAASSSQRYFDYYFTDTDIVDGEILDQLRQVRLQVDQHNYDIAVALMEELYEAIEPQRISSHSHARLLSNAGLLKAVSGEPDRGMLLIGQAIEWIETTQGPYDELLIDLLTLQGVIASDQDEFEVAEDNLRRAQHIAHRLGGVYTRRQLKIVDLLTGLSLSRNFTLEADRQQRFSLKINEQVYGHNSEELVPILEKLGSYFADRGNTIPLRIVSASQIPQVDPGASTEQYRIGLFRESIELYERAIKIIEDNYGANDLRLVPALKGLADTRLKQRTSRRYAEQAMERMLEIVASNPATDIADHARALVDLADIYTVTSDRRAHATYLEAWNLLDAHPELDDVKNELFGMPRRLYPEKNYVIRLDRLPSHVDGDTTVPLYADVEFSVIDDGRVSDVRVIDGNVPNEEKNYIRKRLGYSRYRPRIVDGEFVETQGLMLHQAFEYVEPERSMELNVNTNTVP